ncbi:hypothetical protein AYI68_g6446 [Smittium mucronatum]|uniref:Uncharacterized protein n=1 Tax=Smittium mucronatum TaxID=133383 RepID=A0A1R0GRH1_9FUNG|nr:hypothetical protein AYI68_g6446 [Smittium mucronatum]
MHFSKFFVLISSAITQIVAQSNDLKIDVLVPVGTSGDVSLVVKQTVPLPDLEALFQDPNYEPKLFTSADISSIGFPQDFFDFIKSNETFPKNIKCINCDTKNRAVYSLRYLEKHGYCKCGLCRYPGTKCCYDPCREKWYGCIPDCFIKSKTTTTSTTSTTTSTTTTTRRSIGFTPVVGSISFQSFSSA